jgi:hypothetical protein
MWLAFLGASECWRTCFGVAHMARFLGRERMLAHMARFLGCERLLADMLRCGSPGSLSWTRATMGSYGSLSWARANDGVCRMCVLRVCLCLRVVGACSFIVFVFVRLLCVAGVCSFIVRLLLFLFTSRLFRVCLCLCSWCSRFLLVTLVCRFCVVRVCLFCMASFLCISCLFVLLVRWLVCRFVYKCARIAMRAAHGIHQRLAS